MDAEAFSKTGINVGCGTNDDAMMCRTRGINIYLDVMLKGLERKIIGGHLLQEQIRRGRRAIGSSSSSRATQEETEYVRQVVTALYGTDYAYTKTAVARRKAAGKIHKDSARRLPPQPLQRRQRDADHRR